MKRKYGKTIEHMIDMKKGFDRSRAAQQVEQDAASFLENNISSMIEIPCPACQSTCQAPWSIVHGFQYVKCTECYLVYLNPHPTVESLTDYYNSSGWENRSSTYFDESVLRIRQEHVVIPRIKFVCEFGPIKSWLDLGCGNGELVYGCRQLEIKAQGVELNKQSVLFDRRQFGLDLIESDTITYIKNNSLSSYDVVSLFGVIEHMADTNQLMTFLSQKMSVGSLLVLAVPLAESMSSLLQRSNIKLTGRHLSPPSHVSLWGEASLNALLNRYNYQMEGIWQYGQDAFEIYYHLIDLLDNRESELLKSSLSNLQEAIDKSGLSDEMVIVASKND